MSPPRPATVRDPRLDFFRGLAILIIFVAHIPENLLADYTPGRFGFSDSAEIFIFVSGYAVALAFGRSYLRAGFFAGTARTLLRCWQLYVAHLGLFFALAAICVAGNRYLGGIDYIGRLNLYFFFNSTQDALLGLFTLRYVPNYFDILPMYIVALGLLPLMMALARLHVMLVAAASLALYAATWRFGWAFPAEVASARPWFFNPLAWQLLFFTGFMLGMGWLRPPPLSRRLVWLCLALVLLSAPLNHYPWHAGHPWLSQARYLLDAYAQKTDFGLLRWAHFLALACLALAFLESRRHWLHGRLAAPLVKVGQQSLPIFLLGMTLSYVAGMALDVAGRDFSGIALVNLGGLGLLIAAAYGVAWFKGQPWKKTAPAPRRAEAPAPPPRAGHAEARAAELSLPGGIVPAG